MLTALCTFRDHLLRPGCSTDGSAEDMLRIWELGAGDKRSGS